MSRKSGLDECMNGRKNATKSLVLTIAEVFRLMQSRASNSSIVFGMIVSIDVLINGYIAHKLYVAIFLTTGLISRFLTGAALKRLQEKHLLWLYASESSRFPPS